MSGKGLQHNAKSQKMNGPSGATNTSPALEHSEPDKEVRHMSHYGHYGDSTIPCNPEQSSNWKSIGELAKQLAEKQAGGK